MHRSLLITTCADERLMVKQSQSDADVAFLELEDGVPLDKKVEARSRAVTALTSWDYGNKERWVRINQPSTLDGMRDIVDLAEGRPDALIPSKVRSANELIAVDYLLSRREEELGLPAGQIALCPMIETGPAMLNLRDIITSTPRVKGLLLGTYDLSVDLGLVHTPEETESQWLRGHLVMTAHALGVECYDVTSLHINKPDLVYAEARTARIHGFDGKACISPSQVDAIHRAFAPTEDEIIWAKRLIAADREAAAKGSSVFVLDEKMIDAPLILQAARTLRMAGIDA